MAKFGKRLRSILACILSFLIVASMLGQFFHGIVLVPPVLALDPPSPVLPPPATAWNKTYAGGGAFSVIQTRDGGLAMVGDTATGSGDWDAMLVKTDENGTVQLFKMYGGPYDDGAESVVQTSDGGYAIAGYSIGFSINSATNKSQLSRDYWLVKTDEYGNLEWSQRYGDGLYFEHAFSVVQTKDGGYALAGMGVSVDGPPKFWLVKTNSTGRMEWNRILYPDDGFSEYAYSMVQTSDGGYAITGYQWNLRGNATHYIDQADVLLVKTDSFGNPQWGKTFGGDYDDLALSLIQTKEKDFILAGMTQTEDFDYDFLLAKFSASGRGLWNRTYGGKNHDGAYSLGKTNDGGYVIAGATYSYGDVIPGHPDAWLVKVDYSGNLQWSKTYGGGPNGGGDGFYSVIQTVDGGYAAAGTTYVPSSGGGYGGYYSWLVKTQSDDADGDGLYDVWEKQGIDFDGDGVDLDLPSLGANWQRKDLFLEIDYMGLEPFGTHDHRPDTNAKIDVINAFRDAPVKNPDGSTGITLHIEVDEEIPHQDVLYMFNDFDSIKLERFGTHNQRNATNSVDVLSAKRLVYRYALFAHQYADLNASGFWETTTSGGIAELSGNDFIVSLGAWTNNRGTRDEQAGILMHELGHTLGLQHGGGDEIHAKPNYLSVMSYSRTFPGLLPNRKLDYSRAKLPTLDENALNENVGIAGPTGDYTIYGPVWYNPSSKEYQGFVVFSQGPIDWDTDLKINSSALVSKSVNDFTTVNFGDTDLGLLEGYDDWSNLVYDFRSTRGFADGVHLNVVDQEITWEIVQAMYNITTVGFHDVAITNMTLSNSVIAQGNTTLINTTVQNQGDYTETFNVTIYANAAEIGNQTLTLERTASSTVIFAWNTSSFSTGTYAIRAYVTPVPDEIDTTDNENLKYARVWDPTVSWATSQITNNTYADEGPLIDAGKIVWIGKPPSATEGDVFLYDDSTNATTQISNYGLYDLVPQIDAGKIVWMGEVQESIYREIFLYDIQTGTTTRITSNDYFDASPQIDAGKVVWHGSDDGSDYEIFLYDIQTGTTTKITNNTYNDYSAKIKAQRIVWLADVPNDYDAEIFLYDIQTGTTTQITNNNYEDASPQIGDGKIVWQGGYPSSDWEIYLYDISSGTTTQITNNIYQDGPPQIDNGKVVWQGRSSDGGSDDEIFLYDITTGTTTQITYNNYADGFPQISGEKIVWKGYQADTDFEIFLYDILSQETTQITDNNFDDSAPQIDDENVVWYGFDGSDYEIFLYAPVYVSQPPLPPYDVTANAYCNTENADVNVAITLDDASTGFTTHTFAGLTDTHTLTVPNIDPHGHLFKKWSTGSTNTTITVSTGAAYTAYYEGPSVPYDVTITAYSYKFDSDLNVAISMDGVPTGYNTPYTFTGLQGAHNFTVPNTDTNGHSLKHWNTGSITTTITVSSGGTYTAHYKEPSPSLPPYYETPPPLRTLFPIRIYSSDSLGNPKDTFTHDDTVYVTVEATGQKVSLYIMNNKTSLNNGENLADISDGAETKILLLFGKQIIQIWDSPSKIGSYTIIMDVNNNGIFDLGLDVVSANFQVIDTTWPTANAGPDQTVNEDTAFAFDGSDSYDDDGITSYTWTFIDVEQRTLNGVNPSYIFYTPGVYTVTLNVSDAAGHWSTDTLTVTVLDITKPTANAGLDQTVDEDSLVAFDASASSDNVGIVSYTWAFTDVTVKTLTGEKQTYTFNTPGVYTITLKVTDAAGNWATHTRTITVLDITKPTANAGQDQTVNAGEIVNFDAGASTDNVGVVSYEWSFGDENTGTAKTATHTYTSPGNYIVTLIVKDAAGNTATDTAVMTVRSPEAGLTQGEPFPLWLIVTIIAAIAGIILILLFLWKGKIKKAYTQQPPINDQPISRQSQENSMPFTTRTARATPLGLRNTPRPNPYPSIDFCNETRQINDVQLSFVARKKSIFHFQRFV